MATENEYSSETENMQHVIKQAGTAYRNTLTVRVVDVEPLEPIPAPMLAKVMPTLKARRREYAAERQEARVLVIDEIIAMLEANS